MLRIDDTDGVRTVTFDRPDRRNALTPELLDALEDAVTDPSEPVVHLRGAGAAFCAGADLDVDTDRVIAFAEHGQRVARAIADSPAVVLAGVDGAARGGVHESKALVSQPEREAFW